MTADEFNQQIATLQAAMQTQEYAFDSQVPILGKGIQAFRKWWNNISTRWYVKDYARQQVQFQNHLIQLLQDMHLYHQARQSHLEQRIVQLTNDLAEKDRRIKIAQRMLESDIDQIMHQRFDQLVPVTAEAK